MPVKAKKQKVPLGSLRSELLKRGGDEPEHEDVDVAAMATVLSAEYPLLDQPLIIAILSDHDPSSLYAELPAIRDQLGILEASLVPDPEEPSFMDVIDSVGSLTVDEQPTSSSSALSRTTTTSVSDEADPEAEGSVGTAPTSTVGEEEEGFLDELELLRSLFPKMDKSQLQDALPAEPSFPAAIDHLLSVELIKDVEERGEWPEEHTTAEGEQVQVAPPINMARPIAQSLATPSSTSSSSSTSVPAAGRKARSKRKQQITVPLVDTLKRSAPSSPALTPSSPCSRSRTQSPARRSKPVSRPADNAWGTMASLASHLSDLLPHPASHFVSYLHSPKYFSPYSAVRASLVDLPASPLAQADERSRQVLEEMYGVALGEATLQTQADLEVCTRVAGGDVATVMDLMDLLAEISLWGGDDDLGRYDQYSATTKPGKSPGSRSIDLPVPTPATIVPPATTAGPSTDRQSAKERFADRKKAPPLLANGTTEDFKTELMMRPGSDARTKVVIPDRLIPGAKAGSTSTTNPTAHDDFGTTSSGFAAGAATAMGRSKSNPGRQVHPLNWRHVNHEHERQKRIGQLHPYATHIPSYARGALPHDATPGSLYTAAAASDGSMTVEECLRRAQAEREKRTSNVRLAGQHFRATGTTAAATRGSVAGSYAMRAREQADLARQWELKAARMVVMRRLEQTGHTIDLHHLTIQEAKAVVLEAAEKWWEREKLKFAGFAPEGFNTQRPKTITPGRNLTVITGVGRHSAGKTGVLGPAVANTLEENGWKVERGERSRGYLAVTGRRM